MITLDQMILTNAAGMVKTFDEGKELLNSNVTRITLGSYTAKPRPGHIGVTYYYDENQRTAWNSKGLNNRGVEELLSWLPSFHRACQEARKELAVSIAGFSPHEYGELAAAVSPYCDLIEVNAGCGNVWKDNVQKPIPSYEPGLLDAVLGEVAKSIDLKRCVTVKLSPVGPELIESLGKVLYKHPVVIEAICTNTLPNQHPAREHGNNALVWQEGEGSTTKHTGGMSGKLLAPLSQRVLAQLIDQVPRLRYVGCGGIFDARDALDYLNMQAAGIAVGTAFFESDRNIFARIMWDLATLIGND